VPEHTEPTQHWTVLEQLAPMLRHGPSSSGGGPSLAEVVTAGAAAPEAAPACVVDAVVNPVPAMFPVAFVCNALIVIDAPF